MLAGGSHAAGRPQRHERRDRDRGLSGEHTRLDLLEDTIDFVVVEDGNAVTANGAAYIETPFLKLAGIPKLQLLKLSGAEFSKAVLASAATPSTTSKSR